jgi:Bacterial transcriptional activator domain
MAIDTLESVIDLIAGVPFEGTAYTWPDAEGITSQLIVLAISATAALAEHQLSVGDVDGVFRSTGRGLQVLPGHEHLIGLRMRAHARAGDLAGVRQEWERYERTLGADPWSDGEPAPKLVELRRQLLNPSR